MPPSLLTAGLGSVQNKVRWDGWGSWKSPGAQQSWVPGLTRLHAGWATLAGPLSSSVCIYATGIKMPPHGIVVKVEQDDKPAVWEAPSLLPWSPP